MNFHEVECAHPLYLTLELREWRTVLYLNKIVLSWSNYFCVINQLVLGILFSKESVKNWITLELYKLLTSNKKFFDSEMVSMWEQLLKVISDPSKQHGEYLFSIIMSVHDDQKTIHGDQNLIKTSEYWSYYSMRQY